MQRSVNLLCTCAARSHGNGGDDSGEARNGSVAMAGGGNAGDDDGDGGDGGAAAAPRKKKKRSPAREARGAMARATNEMYDIVLRRTTAAHRGRFGQRSCIA